MKTVKQIVFALAIGLLLNVPSFARSIESQPLPTVNYPEKPAFEIGMYRDIHSLNINLMIEKVLGQWVTVEVLNEQGKVLYRDVIEKKQRKYARALIFSEMSDGQYDVVISSGSQKVVRQVQLATHKLYEMPKRLLVVEN